jgi:UDP:flavonoid glycosyltransferase YjiC (YdhE family)
LSRWQLFSTRIDIIESIQLMQHILIVWELGGNLGHLARLHLTAQELARRGTKVTFAVRNYAGAAPWLAARGWPCVPAPRTTSHGWDTTSPVGHADWFMCEGFEQAGQIQALIRDWAVVIEHLKPDALLLDFAPSATYAAHYLQLPYLVSSVGFCAPPYFDKAACFRPWEPQSVQKAQAADDKLKPVFSALRQRLGFLAAADLQALYPAQAVRLCTFPEMDHFADRTPGAAYTGVLWDESASLPSVQWAGAGHKKVFCYLNGPVHHVTPLLEVLKKHQHDAIVVAPHVPPNKAADYASAHLQVFAQPVSVRALLREADVTVTHGGVGLVGQSLCAGVPLLLLSQHAEQALLARRMVQQHFGVATFRATAQDLLEQKLDAVLENDAIKSEAQQFAQRQQHFSTQDAAKHSVAPWLEKI